MKATVHYDATKPFGRIGDRFFCFPMDHTSPFVSNTREILTSPIVTQHEDGSVETENSIYVPYENKLT